MREERKIIQFLKEKRLLKRPRAFSCYITDLLGGINFRDRVVLDVGAGNGLYSFYMAMKGARKVVGLEPECAGSTKGYIGEFEKNCRQLKLDNINLLPVTFQEFDSRGEKFDVILLHYSINHLNENACILLDKSKQAWNIYRQIFEKIYSLANQNAWIIIADCSKYNFFNTIGVKNIFTPMIEWHKHQSPELWVKILREAGISRDPKIQWVSPGEFGKLGKAIFANKLMSFFIHSHFIIKVKKIINLKVLPKD